MNEHEIVELCLQEDCKSAFERVYNLDYPDYTELAIYIQYVYFTTTALSLVTADFLDMIKNDPSDICKEVFTVFNSVGAEVGDTITEMSNFQRNVLVKEKDPERLLRHMLKVINAYYDIPSKLSMMITYIVQKRYGSDKQNAVVKIATEYEDAYYKLQHMLKKPQENEWDGDPINEITINKKHERPTGFHKAKHHKKKGRR